MRILSTKLVFVHRPFQGQGVSVYAGEGQPRYRKPRVMPACPIPLGTAFTSEKTARLTSEAGTGELEVDATLPAALIDNPNVAIDARHYRDDVENESARPQIVSVDSSGDGEDVIEGRAILIQTELRTGGGVRFHFRYEHYRGTPARFRWARLSGPTSPSDVTETYGGPGLYFVDFSGLSASAYAFRLTIENTGATVTKTLIATTSVTPNSTGPDAPTSVSAEVL
jgi:hypothetical protein